VTKALQPDTPSRRRPAPVGGRGAGVARVLLLAGLWVLPPVAVLAAPPLTAALDADSVSAPRPTTVTVGSRDVDRAIAVNAVATLSAPPELRAAVDGTLTGLGTPGELGQGSEVFAIDGVPVLAYRGAVLHRDLARDDRGQDVAALSQFLVELDLLDGASVGDQFGPALESAVTELQQRIGVEPDGVFRLAYISYVPEGADELADAVVGLGDRIAVGDPVWLAQAPVESVVLTPVSTGNLAGYVGNDLALRLGGFTVDISGIELAGAEAASLTTALDEAVRTGAARVEMSSGSPSTYSGAVLVLRSPTTTGVVPSTAVLIDAAGRTCVVAVDGDPADSASLSRLPLVSAVAGSELGTVAIDESTIGAVVIRDVSLLAEADSTCG